MTNISVHASERSALLLPMMGHCAAATHSVLGAGTRAAIRYSLQAIVIMSYIQYIGNTAPPPARPPPPLSPHYLPIGWQRSRWKCRIQINE